MGILTDMNKGMRAEFTAGALMAASLFGAAGCSSKPDPTAGLAVDSRTAGIVDASFETLTLPSIRGNKIELQLADRQFSTIELSTTRSYLITVPTETFIELRNAVVRNSGMTNRNETNDSFLFELRDNDLRHYELETKSHRFCDRTRSSESSINDGTYVILVDTAKNREIVSAVRIPSYGWLTGESGMMDGLFYFKTPDGNVHTVKTPIQKFASDAHTNPADIQHIQNKIHPTQSGDALMTK